MLDAALLEELNDGVHIVAAAGGAGRDQTARRMNAELFEVDDGGRQEIPRDCGRGGCVSDLAAFRVRDAQIARCAEHRAMGQPISVACWPNLTRVFLRFAEAALGARLTQELLLFVDAELIPIERVLAGVFLGLADDLAVAFAEQRNGVFGNIGQDDGLLVRIIGDADAEGAQPVGELNLKIGAVLRDFVSGQGAGVERTDAAVFCDDHVRDEIVQMVMRIAGDRGVDQIGGAARAVLDGKRGPRGVVSESDPADFAMIRAVFACMAFARPGEIVGRIMERFVIGGPDCVADGRGL